METTKAFANWTGKDRHLTREQYILEWLDATIQFGALSYDDKFTKAFLEFRGAIVEQAGKKWDESK
jgi:hypothetical protein